MRWRDLLRSERGEIIPHASRGLHEFDQAYGFELDDSPACAKGAASSAERSKSRRHRWRFILRSKK
jgi:hypothetical protein